MKKQEKNKSVVLPPNSGMKRSMAIIAEEKDFVEEQSSKDGINPANLSKEKSRPETLDPTRYGDWERKGRCIDF